MDTEVSEQFIVISSDHTYYGPFLNINLAEDWGNDNEEMLGDWFISSVYRPD